MPHLLEGTASHILKSFCRWGWSDAYLEVDFHIDRLFHRDREAAGLPRSDDDGWLVFHSLRHTYCTLIVGTGANMIEAQRLMRHSDPRLTANIYSHTQKHQLQHVAEAVGKSVIVENTALLRQQRTVDLNGADVNACRDGNSDELDIEAGEGVRTLDFDLGKVALYH